MNWREHLEWNDDVATVSDLVAAGLPSSTLADRVALGRWQRVLPGVIVAHSGPIGELERYRCALAYGRAGAVLSHESAGALLGLRVADERVHTTVPHGRPHRSREFVVVHQAMALSSWCSRKRMPCTTVARTVADIARHARELDDVRTLLSDAVQRRLTTVRALDQELASGARNGSRLFRIALSEVDSGVRSAGEGRLWRVLRDSNLPAPELNVPIDVQGHRFIVDALWRAERLIVEVDGMAWHLSARQWQQDLRRQNILLAAGYLVLRFPVNRIREDPDAVLAEIDQALRLRRAS